jgi:RluA family pseudouridine synthase
MSTRPPDAGLAAALTPEGLLARVLYRDALMLVLDKPAGIAVHLAPGRGPHLEQYLDALRFGLPQAPKLAHRLDRDTSGCLVLGRHRKALAMLSRLFAAGRVEKIYWAVVAGTPTPTEGRIELAMRERTPGRGWHMAVDPDGRPAVTDYRVLGRSGGLSWLDLRPRTGRTHQIRVHCAAMGWPVLGDRIYGPASAAENGPALHLHARAVAVPLHHRRPPIEAVAPPPLHMLDALRSCGLDPAAATTALFPAVDHEEG